MDDRPPAMPWEWFKVPDEWLGESEAYKEEKAREKSKWNIGPVWPIGSMKRMNKLLLFPLNWASSIRFFKPTKKEARARLKRK